MEMIRTGYRIMLVRLLLWVLLPAFVHTVSAQSSIKTYTIRNGRMYIELGKKISSRELDSFIARYNLSDLSLEHLIRTNSTGPIKRLGWKVETNNKRLFVISKPLYSDNIINTAQKILFTQNQRPNILFPEHVGKIGYGYNRFTNKYPFAISGSTVTFFLRNSPTAKKVMLAGSFNNWLPDALPMKKTDSGWIVNVKLDAGKHWYKFIIDGNWDIDNDNLLKENDGRGNVNSVFYKTNFIFKLEGFLNSRKVYLAGSFNNWRPNELLMNKTHTGWQLPLYLGDGTHTYKFGADGIWITDPKNEKRLPGSAGGYNSVIQIGKPYVFKLNGYTNAKQVGIMGSFNNWRSNEFYMTRTAGGWELPFTLGAGNYEYKFIVDGKQITDPGNPQLTTDTKNKGNSFLVIDPNYIFRLRAFSSAKTVFLSGDFNDWNFYSLPMKHDGDVWSVNVNLTPGKHLYKFIVDGKWIIDPGNKLWEQNEYGTGNSVLWIEK